MVIPMPSRDELEQQGEVAGLSGDAWPEASPVAGVVELGSQAAVQAGRLITGSSRISATGNLRTSGQRVTRAGDGNDGFGGDAVTRGVLALAASLASAAFLAGAPADH